MLADSTIDAVLLATPHSLHPAQVKACAAARKARVLRKAAGAPSRRCRGCSTPARRRRHARRRAQPPLLAFDGALRDIVASGELGTILHVEGHNSNENSKNVIAGWRLSPEESPGGGLTGAGLHILDAFVSLLGPVRRVYAQHNRVSGAPSARHRDDDDRFRQRRHRHAGDGAGDAALLAGPCFGTRDPPKCWMKPR